MAALGLNCKINPKAKFSRKNYFYPDLPKGYQITSQPDPFGLGGYVQINPSAGSPRVRASGSRTGSSKIKIHHLHLEEDTGRLLHSPDKKSTLVDFNRAGTPLLEIVSEPEIESGTEARTYCQQIQQTLRYLGVADADMEKGQMRCEVNISVSPDKKKMGAKVEIKNLNSFKSVENSIDYEIQRQTKILEDGGKIVQENRGWDEDKMETLRQRTKEEAHDYRYFPEPDLPPLDLDKLDLESIKADMPELPEARKVRLINQYELSAYDAGLLVSDKDLADYAENVISELRAWLIAQGMEEGTQEEVWEKSKKKLAKLVANWLLSELLKHLREQKITMAELKVTPENFAELITLIFQNRINSSAAQTILNEMIKTDVSPTRIMEEKDLSQMGGGDELDQIIDKVIAANPKQVSQFQAGKEPILQFLIGLVMKESKGKADPKMVAEMLRERLRA